MSTSHWETVQLSEIAEVRLGRQRSPKRATGPNMRPYMRAANVTWSGISLHNVKEMDFTAAEFKTYALRDGDLLLAEASGSASEVGKPAVWAGQVPDCCFQNTLIRVRAHEDLVPFLHLQFKKDAVTGAFARASRGVGIHHLGAKALSDWNVQVPPLGEQHRIVDAIDSYFTRLDDAVADLDRAQRNLRRYRASVLKAAVEGRLVPTEAELARADGRDYEPADELVARTENPPRPARYGSRARVVIQGHAALAVGHPDTELPEGWVWASLVDIARLETGHTPSRKHPEWWGGDVSWIGIKDARKHHGGVIHRTIQHTNQDGLANSAARLLPAGTVCLSRTASVGYVVVMGHKMATSQDFVNWVCTEALDPHWLRYVLLADREGLRRFGKGTTHTTIYFPEVVSMHVALPPIAEQKRIVARLDQLMSQTDMLCALVEANAGRLLRVRQSILKWAFSGRLVDQDPSDESAEALLNRIEAERVAAASSSKTTKRGRRKPRSTKP